MSSSFNFGSASSARSSVRDALQSYRRAQYLVAGSTVASASDASALAEDEADEEAQLVRPRAFRFDSEAFDSDDESTDVLLGDGTPRTREGSFIAQMHWDEDYDSASHPAAWQQRRQRERLSQRLAQDGDSIIRSPVVGSLQSGAQTSEQTPLLKKVSFSVLPSPRRYSEAPVPDKLALAPTAPGGGGAAQQPANAPLGRRRYSSASAVSNSTVVPRGQSTFGQTLFNSIAILLGVGILSQPLAFAYAGWALGTVLIITYGFVSCYTAKILARIILGDPRVRSYADIGRKAFGPKVTPLISLMFCLELFTVCVILVTLYGDSLHVLLPQYSSNTLKLWGLLILIPTVFLPLSLLSYTSIIGIISTISMVVVLFIDGFSKKEAPGSLWNPCPTDIGVTSYRELGLAFGLFMAGFAGHAVIPSLAKDMADPTYFNIMINWAFVIATALYAAIGYAGYLMFGNNVSDEISMDLLRTPGFNPLLNKICLCMLVLTPLSKFALNAQPLNAMIEILLGTDPRLSSPEDLADKPDGLSVAHTGSSLSFRRFIGIAQRVCLTGLVVAVSILVPEFSSMMAILGSFSAFMLSIIGPVVANVVIEGVCSLFDGAIIVTGAIMAVWGTAVVAIQ